MDAQPLVSVLMPAYNLASFLPAAIESVLAQTYPHIELVIVNDGSTDNTLAICQSYATIDSRIAIFSQQNRGLPAARNVGIKKSKGAYICLLDADDCMDKYKVEKQLLVLQQNPDIDIVYTAISLIDEKGKFLGEIHDQDYSPENLKIQMFFRNVMPNPITVMARRYCFDENLFNENFRRGEDYELMMRLIHLYRFKYLDIPLTLYRRHSKNMSNELVAQRETELKILKTYSKEHIEKLFENSALSAEEKLLMKGKIFFNMEWFEEALEILRPLKQPLALFYQGNCYLKLNQIQKAADCYKRSLALDPANPACYNNLGAVINDTAHAKEAFTKALQLKPGYLDAQFNLEHCEETTILRITWKELRPSLLPYNRSYSMLFSL